MNFSTRVNSAKLFNLVYLFSSLQTKKVNVDKNWTLGTKCWYVKKISQIQSARTLKLSELNVVSYYIHTVNYAPKSIKKKIVSSRQRNQLIDHRIFFTSEKRRIDPLIGYIIIFTSEPCRLLAAPLD